MRSLFGGIYRGKRILLTGHTGFKGSWMAAWLQMMGADVHGFALAAPSGPSHIDILKLDLPQCIGDIRDATSIDKYMAEVQPEMVFHLAAQALVRDSYDNPVETFTSNVLGTLNVLEACRKTKSVRAIVNITSDKCYDNKEWIWGYRENDAMGGYDPYSASKGCAELLTSSYRNSFFNLCDYGSRHNVLLASGRAGNVIGGGDWAKDRIVPDMVRAASQSIHVSIRNPKATRPWQHVLEPLSGYLMLGWRLLEGKKEYAEGWNFGPSIDSNLTVDELAKLANKFWGKIIVKCETPMGNAHEANLLMLDCSKANNTMHWSPVWDIHATLDRTISWYRDFYTRNATNSLTDIEQFVVDARKKNMRWSI